MPLDPPGGLVRLRARMIAGTAQSSLGDMMETLVVPTETKLELRLVGRVPLTATLVRGRGTQGKYSFNM